VRTKPSPTARTSLGQARGVGSAWCASNPVCILVTADGQRFPVSRTCRRRKCRPTETNADDAPSARRVPSGDRPMSDCICDDLSLKRRTSCYDDGIKVLSPLPLRFFLPRLLLCLLAVRLLEILSRQERDVGEEMSLQSDRRRK